MPSSGYTICTSEQRLASTAVSHGFAIARHSSPPFGSLGPCKHSEPCPMGCGSGVPCRCDACQVAPAHPQSEMARRSELPSPCPISPGCHCRPQPPAHSNDQLVHPLRGEVDASCDNPRLCCWYGTHRRTAEAGFSKITPANLQAPKTPWSVFQDGQGAALIPHQAPHCRVVRMPQSTPGSIRRATQVHSSHHQCGATPTHPAAPETVSGHW